MHSYALVQKSGTPLLRRRQSLPVAYVLNNRIVTPARFLFYSCLSLHVPRKVLLRLPFVFGARRGRGVLWVPGV